MYNKKELNSERLQFIINYCTAYLNISSSFIKKKLMKDNNKELLEILFKNHLKFFDNKFILNLLKHYQNKTPITNSELSSLINSYKYIISTELVKILNNMIVPIIYLMLVKVEMKQL